MSDRATDRAARLQAVQACAAAQAAITLLWKAAQGVDADMKSLSFGEFANLHLSLTATKQLEGVKYPYYLTPAYLKGLVREQQKQIEARAAVRKFESAATAHTVHSPLPRGSVRASRWVQCALLTV
jgi:hypothetical protein